MEKQLSDAPLPYRWRLVQDVHYGFLVLALYRGVYSRFDRP
ncbi:MAG TPA: hypothetical protein VLA84_15055 [Microcoleus sp.]|nr:hypothetical protein [Microcoleus sp.]